LFASKRLYLYLEMQKIRTIDTLTIESSLLCHNFINTVYAWRGENLNEYLKTYQDVVDWCRKLGVLAESQLASLAQLAVANPHRADKALVKMKEVRQLLYTLVSAIANNKPAEIKTLLRQLNPLIEAASQKFELVYQNESFTWIYIMDAGDLEAPVWPVLHSLQEMLLNEDLSRIKECPTCGWVFLDQTKNRGRKWCSAVECGTRDKMSRYNLKRKADGRSKKNGE
jgi:predicted RNA-binding Zn ribbon-like protein